MPVASTKIKNVKLYDMQFYDISDFIDDEHPQINGYYEYKKYQDYWKVRLEKMLQGVWGYDYDSKTGQGGWRWMSGNLYSFRNFFTIERSREDGMIGSGVKGFPTLRGIDWYLDSLFSEMDGFSGFKDDPTHTCHFLVRKVELGVELNALEQKQFDYHKKFLVDKNGRLKTFVSPREYIWKHHNEPMGEALWLNNRKNMLLLTSRRLGKSYHAANRMFRAYVLNGARTLEDFLSGDTVFNGVIGGFSEGDIIEAAKKWWTAYEELKKIGAYEVEEYDEKEGDLDGSGYFWEPHSGSQYQVGSEWTNSVKEAGGSGRIGAGSTIALRNYSANDSAGVGKAADQYWTEEIGTSKRPGNFATSWSENDGATERDGIKFGNQLGVGTGGKVENAKNIRDPFLKPHSVNSISQPNHFVHNGKDTCIMIPTQFHILDFYDPLGNFKDEEAFKYALDKRIYLQKKDEQRYIKESAKHPMHYEDIFVGKDEGFFPKVRASERLSVVVVKNNADVRPYKIGKLHCHDFYNRNVYFEEDDSLTPIMNHEQMDSFRKDGMIEGAFVQYEEPDPKGRYLMGFDPTAHDIGTSLACFIVFKLGGTPGKMKMQVAAEWIGRYGDYKEDDRMALKIAMYYNDQFLPEMNNPHIKKLWEEYDLEDIIADCPVDAAQLISPTYKPKYDPGYFKGGGGTRSMETGHKRITGGFLKEVLTEKKTESGDYEEVWIIDKLNSEMGLNDITSYTKGGNFDWLSAFDLITLQYEQKKLEGSFLKKRNNKSGDTVSKAIRSTMMVNTSKQTSFKQIIGF